MWNEGKHIARIPEETLNDKLGKIKGSLGPEEAQIWFAKFCHVNPYFAVRLLIGIEIAPIQDLIVRALMKKDFSLIIAGRGFSKSFTISIFIILYALFYPGSRIGICSGTFRQSKLIFKQIEKFFNEKAGHFLRQCVDTKNISHSSDAWEMKIGLSYVVATPLGCVGPETMIGSDVGFSQIQDNFYYKKTNVPNTWSKFDRNIYQGAELKHSPQKYFAGSVPSFKITTENGYSIEISEEHKLKKLFGDNFDWEKAVNLSVGDVLQMDSAKKSVPNPVFKRDFADGYLLGLICSSDFYTKEFTPKSNKATTDYKKSLFAFSKFVQEYKSNIPEWKYLGFLDQAKCKKWIASWGKGPFFYNDNFDEKILLHSGEKCVSGFISGCLDSESRTVFTKRTGYGIHYSPKLKSKSKLVHFLLLTLGIKSKLFKNGDILISQPDLYNLFNNTKSFSIEKKQEYDRVLALIPENEKTVSATFSGKIKSIEKSKQFCFDISVPDGNWYSANGFISHNTGDRIRGYRFNVMVIDELLLVPGDIINTVIKPFLSVKLDGQDRERLEKAQDILINAGKMKEEDRIIPQNNKLIGLSSASFKFESLYKDTYLPYIEAITNEHAKNVNHCVFRLSYRCAPSWLLDQKLVEESRRTMSSQQFQREFDAIFTDDSGGYFSARKVEEASVGTGSKPCVRIKGDPNKKYVLAIDPNYNDAETSDHFAMAILELDEENKSGTLVHCYALSKSGLKNRASYLNYILTHFNIVYFIVDGAGGEQFIREVKELDMLPYDLSVCARSSFLVSNEFEKEISQCRAAYNKGSGAILHVQAFSESGWMRRANEVLQGNIEHKKIAFASKASMCDFFDQTMAENIPINDLVFNSNEDVSSDTIGKKAEFIDHLENLIALTKKELTLIEPKEGLNGNQIFDLPSNLKRDKSPNKARKDSYSALLLACWGMTTYFELLKQPEKSQIQIIMPFSFN